MDWRNLYCNDCRVKFWSPKHGKLHRRVTIAGCYYCERCARRKQKHEKEIEILNRNCAIRNSPNNHGKIVIVAPMQKS